MSEKMVLEVGVRGGGPRIEGGEAELDHVVRIEDPTWIHFQRRGMVVAYEGRLVFWNWRIVGWWACPEDLANVMVDDYEAEMGMLLSKQKAKEDAAAQSQAATSFAT